MKIGFDVSDLCTGRADGTTRYTRELAARLPVMGREHEWRYFAPCSPLGSVAASVHWHASPWPKFWTQSRLAWELFRYPVDTLFMPIQQLPILRPAKMKTVAVIHDLAFHAFGEQYTRKDWALLHVFSAQVAREADHIICVSRATASDVEKFYGRTENVHVVHHGVDFERFSPDVPALSSRSFQPAGPAARLHPASAHEFRAVGGPTSRHPLEDVFAKPYLLFVGQIQPRKNLERLVEAFEVLAEKDSDLRLVIAGSHGWLREPILERIKTSVVADRIVQLGRVDDDDLPGLYAGAEVFVLPSLSEGFGMPILEAMASGAPVVTSNVSSLPEVAGKAAVLIDPYRVESIVEGVREARRRKEELREKGFARAKEFTWEKTVQQTLAILTA